MVLGALAPDPGTRDVIVHALDAYFAELGVRQRMPSSDASR